MDREIENSVCKLIETELEKISKMPALNDASLGNLYKLIEIKKGMLKIDKLEMELEDGGMYESGNSFRRNPANGRYVANSYEGGRSGYMPRRYPDNSYDGGYSMTGDSYSHLEAALRDARTESERNAIRQAMSNMYK